MGGRTLFSRSQTSNILFFLFICELVKEKQNLASIVLEWMLMNTCLIVVLRLNAYLHNPFKCCYIESVVRWTLGALQRPRSKESLCVSILSWFLQATIDFSSSLLRLFKVIPTVNFFDRSLQIWATSVVTLTSDRSNNNNDNNDDKRLKQIFSVVELSQFFARYALLCPLCWQNKQ